jgi:hypothetical protein
MRNNGGVKRESGQQEKGSLVIVGILQLAIVCATIIVVVWIIWAQC